jgi:hypothetical protein
MREKIAFCNNSKELSPKAFVDFCKRDPLVKPTKSSGYTSRHICNYLKFLLRNKAIKAYDYHTLSDKYGKDVLRKMIYTSIRHDYKQGNVYIVTGIPITSLLKPKLMKALKKNKSNNRLKAYTQLSERSDVFNKSLGGSCHAFCVALRCRDDDEHMHDLFMFDSALNVAHRMMKTNVDIVLLKSLAMKCMIKVLNITV